VTPFAGFALILLAWALMFGLGALMSLSWGLRRTTAVASALPFSCGLLAVISAASMVRRVPFHPVTVLFCAALVVVLGVGFRAAGRRTPLAAWWDRGRARQSPVNTRMLLVALLAALALTAVPLVLAAGGDLNMSSQTWDALYHENATRYLVETANASPVSTHYVPQISSLVFFYPSGFDTIAALFMQTFGVNSVVACNLAAVVVGGGLWPSGMVLLAHRVFGARASIGPVVAVLSTCLFGLPWAAMGYGVLWPTLAASAWTPVVLTGFLAFGMNVLGRVQRLPQALVGLCVGIGGLLIGLNFHPRALLLLLPVLILAAASLLAQFIAHGMGRRSVAPVVLGASLLVLLVVGSWVGLEKLLGANLPGRSLDWGITTSPGRALLDYLVAGPHDTGPNYLVGGLLILGALACATQLRTLWISVAYLLLATLDVLTATTHIEGFQAFSYYWYNDPYRVATLVPIVGVLMLAAGAVNLSSGLSRLPQLPRRMTTGSPSTALLAALVAVTALSTVAAHTSWLARTYTDGANGAILSMVSPREVAFFGRVRTLVPKGARVLNNPTDGSALLYAYEGIDPLFFHARTDLATEEARALRHDFGTTPDFAATCQRVRATGASWVISLGRTLHESPDEIGPGLAIPRNFPLATLEAQDGDLRLWQITGCSNQ